MQLENSAYAADYDKICQLEADIEVLEKKVADYTRIEAGVQNDFDAGVKKLAEIEIALDELSRFTWKRTKAKLTRKYDEVYDRNMTAKDAAQRELDNAKYRLRDVRGKLKDTKTRLNETKSAYQKQREYMKKTYSEFNEYEKKIQNENLRLRSIIKEIDEALEVVGEVISIAGLAYDKFKSARNWGFADMVFDDGIFCEIFKYNNINDAEGMVCALNAAVARMNKEIRDVNNVYGVYCQEFGTDLKFMDYVFDNIVVDWIALHRIEENMDRLNTFKIKLQDVETSLKNNRKQVEKQLKK